MVMCILALVLPAVQVIFMVVPILCSTSPDSQGPASRFGHFLGAIFALTIFSWSLYGAINIVYAEQPINGCKDPSQTVSA